ncbi:hypothetical protein ANCCAN_06435 [Ancylostoma caninum]|uniref:Uncharacterized protein n=1 Tax=Ancylostoma caninum TaxID=29170 RepID=A0A368GT25_ANCCA|nr:hypothetical protein ANCCAN_06435 [Ancylostoma caninum]
MNNLAKVVKNVLQKINNLQNEQKQIADSLTDLLEKTVKALVQLYTKFLESIEQESGECVDLNVHRPALIKFMYARVSTPVQGLCDSRCFLHLRFLWLATVNKAFEELRRLR